MQQLLVSCYSVPNSLRDEPAEDCAGDIPSCTRLTSYQRDRPEHP